MLSIFGALARRVPRSATLVGVTAVTAGTVLVLGPVGLASPHAPNIGATCGSLNLGFSGYEGGPGNNVLTVVIDGVPHTYSFTGNLLDQIPWDSTIDHTFSWVVDANRNSGDPTAYDASGSGSKGACNRPVTTTTVAPTTTTTLAPTTTTTLAP